MSSDDDEQPGGDAAGSVGGAAPRDDDDAEMMDGLMNELEFLAMRGEVNRTRWLEFPRAFITPAKMCSVNKYVQCVDETFLHHSMHHVPTGPEFVLVGLDSPSLPAHMFQWIWAMTQINMMQQYTGCVVPVQGSTRVQYVKKGKDLVATNLKRRLAVSRGWRMDDALMLDAWFDDMPAQKSVMAEAIEQMRQNDHHYADIEPIQLLWCVVPLSYRSNEGAQRRIAHVLKTIPAPGFDLMRCLVSLHLKRDQKLKNGVSVAAVLQAITEVLNYECNRNLKISGCFGRSHPLPHPMEVLEDAESPMNPAVVLSPFLVMRKIALQLPIAGATELVIEGFPKTDTLEQRAACFEYWAEAQRRYRQQLVRWHRAVGEALKPEVAAGKLLPSTRIAETRLPALLMSSDDESMDGLFSNMTMTFNLKKWLEGGCIMADRAELLRMPQLAVATLTPFQYAGICGDDLDSFISAHLGDQCVNVDETELNLRYSLDNGSWGDMPHGGMYRSARESLRTSIKTLARDVDASKRVQTYQNYLRAQSTIHSQAVLVDLMMSDRVLHCAQCLDRLSGRINAGLRGALVERDQQLGGAEAARQRSALEAYPDSRYYMRMLHILGASNRHIRANAVNLTTLFSFLVSDVLTHLGAHHETWNWMMYTVQVMGGAGHLRAMTDDHSNKTPVIFTSKPNSVGFNAVITKNFKALATMVSELLPDLTSEFLEPMRFMKLDRTTRAGVEGVSSVMFVNGVKENVPSRKTFMRPIIMDEGYRSMDAAALNGLVCSIPRDSDGGSGNILKSIDPGKAGGAHLQGHQRQLPGLSPFLIGMTSNSNPHTPVIGECIKTFSVVTAMFPAGAQVGGQLSYLTSARKRKLTDFSSCNTNSASTLPSDKGEREDLAWAMSVLFMAARQLALVNKTGQVDFEINTVCRQYTEWFRNIVHMHFQAFFGSNLVLSYDRVIAGFLARQVGTTFTATCARHICESDTMAEANCRVLLDMETAPLTVQSTSVALSNALMHLVDGNLIMVNQFIRDRINTPVIPLEFLMGVFGTTPIGAGMPLFDELFAWLGTIMQQGELEYSCGYITVAKLGTVEDYQQKEAFLESYFGVAKNNFYTYLSAIRECSTKSFDLSSFLCTDGSMLDFQRFVSRLGVGHDFFRAENGGPPPAVFETYRNTYMFTQSHAELAAAAGGVQQPTTARGGVGKCWVSLIQHLFVTAIQGNNELHADNMFTFGSNLMEFVLSRCAPIQATPAQVILHEVFQHVDNDVVPLCVATGARPAYFVRSINDFGAVNSGLGTELPPLLGAHPIEDVMHLGSWIQLYTILHSGARPTEFRPLSECTNGRPPELVRGRTYPLLGPAAKGLRGTVCLCAERRRMARITTTDDENPPSVRGVELADWFRHVRERHMMVGPLVFRHHAVFRDAARGAVWVSSCDATKAPGVCDNGHTFQTLLPSGAPAAEPPQFLDTEGCYTLRRAPGEVLRVPFEIAHERLLPLGTFLLVKTSVLGAFGFAANRAWLRASVRYPDEGIVGVEIHPHRVYFALKVRERSASTIRVACADPADCCVLDEHPEITPSHFSLEAIVQPLHARDAV